MKKFSISRNVSFSFYTDKKYSQKLLSTAKKLYDFAYDNRGKYSDSISNANSFYK